MIRFGPFEFDSTAGLLYRGGQETLLPPRTSAVLAVLLESAGELVSKDELITRAWRDAYISESSLTYTVSMLRQVMGDDARNPTFIQTLHGRGYRFIGPVETTQSSVDRDRGASGIETHGALLAPGRKLGNYEILDPVGAGAMGTVYRARDTSLERDVAIKLLSGEIAGDPKKLAQLRREAKLLASVSHPNIAAIHSLEEADGITFPVLELVEGETLGERLCTGALPIDQALAIARQIARALEAAHSRGIVHRDLKPSNIKLTSEGQVKVLDFGLATGLEVSDFAQDVAESPTASLTIRGSHRGAIVGTAAYMSPEQARGQEVDAKADIWAFGCVLYEMLTGTGPFHRQTIADMLAAILESEPDWGALPENTPPAVASLLQRCLAKETDRRVSAAGDARIAIEEAMAPIHAGAGGSARTGPPAGVSRRPRFGPTKWAALALIVVATVVWLVRTVINTPPEPGPADAPERIALTFDGGQKDNPALSPNGRFVAFDWEGPEGNNRDIYIQQVEHGTKPQRITTAPERDFGAVWSPSGDRIAFLRVVSNRATIYEVAAPLGGVEKKLIEIEGPSSMADRDSFSSLAWSPDGRYIAYGERPSRSEPARIMRLELATLVKTELVAPPANAGDGVGDTRPRFSPDGKLVAFVRSSASVGGKDLWLASADGGDPWRLTHEGWRHIHVPTWTPDSRELVFSAGPDQAQRTYRVSVDGGDHGIPRAVEGIGNNERAPDIANGHLVFREVITGGWRNIYRAPGRLAADRNAPAMGLIESPSLDQNQDFSPDGRRIAFRTTRRGHSEIWIANSDGTDPVPLTDGDFDLYAPHWSPNGNQVVYFGTPDDADKGEIFVIDIATRQTRRLTTNSASDLGPTFSRDGQSIYFGSNRSGAWQIYKMPAAGGESGEDAIAVTRGGGFYGIEGPDGYLYYALVSQRVDGVWRVPTDGGQEIEFLRVPLLNFNDFDVAEQGIYYALQDNRSTSRSGALRVFYYPLEKETSPCAGSWTSPCGEEIFREDGWFVWLRISPDETTITFNRNDRPPASELVLMRNFR